jgi:hypothetical protein
MATSVHAPIRGHTRTRGAFEAAAWRHLAWLGSGMALAFLVPFVFADTLEIQRDVYYGLYALFVGGLFVAWAYDTGQSLRAMVMRRWRLMLVLGAVFAVAGALIVHGAEDSGPHPGGLEFAGALLWRGLVYGAADGLLLSAFPIMLVFAALAQLRRRHGGTLMVGAIAMIASLAMTATYHLGYSDFRSEKLRKPVTGDLVWSVPTLATLNPVGAPIAHAGVHISALEHSYETDLFLPPH